MAQPAADRNLLFGILAMQMDFINRDQLIAAMQAWVFDKGKPLGEILLAQKALDPDHRTLLDALVKKHLEKHGGDAEKSLAAISSVGDIKKDLAKIADNDVQTSIGHISIARPGHADPWATVAPSSSMKIPGASRFRIVRPHARGGLGEVFVALDEELHREVALKEIQEPQADDAESRTRFLLEAEITGGLEHPGIVPVYGLGTYADGRPYYAMRFIRGDSLKDAIEQYHKARVSMSAGEQTLAMRGLLGRFVDVCDAIAYAHSRGVLHRDLKPGNIMLGKYGETLVVDWGLAKPMGHPAEGTASIEPGEGSLMPSSMSSASATLLGSAVGTPQYMSPEQAGGRIDQLGPASDVYSLGATLYCILTGQSPINDPDVGTVLQKVQRGKFARPREVRPEVSPALEAICLKAMKLEPDGRYHSPHDLAEDIEHWLADEPVSAWTEPWTAKARRWIGRNATLVTGVASAVVVALVGLVVATILLTAANERERKAKEYAQEQEKEAVKQRDLAEANFKLARSAVDRYHTEVSEDKLLNEPQMEELRKKLLEAAREFYGKFVKERAGDKALQGELGKATYRLAMITGDIDSKKDAIALLQKSATIFDALPTAFFTPDLRGDEAACYHHLGRLYRGENDLPHSEEAYKKALGKWKQLVKDNPKEERFQAGLARTQMGLGNASQAAGHFDVAKASYRDSLASWQPLAAAHPKNPEYRREPPVCQVNLMSIQMQEGGKNEDIEKTLRAAQVAQKKLADDYSHIGKYQDDLALTDYLLGQHLEQRLGDADAAPAYADAARVWQKLVDRHPAVKNYNVRLALTYSALAKVYRRGNDLKNAEQVSDKALKVYRKLAGDYPNESAYQGNLALGYFSLGEICRAAAQSEKAAAAYEDAIRIQNKLVQAKLKLPYYHAELAKSYNGLGWARAADRQTKEAEAAFQKALTIWQALTKENPGNVEYVLGLGATYLNLGELARSQEQLADAQAWFTRARDSVEANKLTESSGVRVRDFLLDVHTMRADVLTKLGQHAKAIQDWDRVVAMESASARKLYYRLLRADSYARAGNHAEATREADALAEGKSDASLLYRVASIYSLSAAAASMDTAKNPDERKKFIDQYAAQSIKLLTSARDAGFFKKGTNAEKLQRDPALEAIRARPEFQKLLKDLKK